MEVSRKALSDPAEISRDPGLRRSPATGSVHSNDDQLTHE